MPQENFIKVLHFWHATGAPHEVPAFRTMKDRSLKPIFYSARSSGFLVPGLHPGYKQDAPMGLAELVKCVVDIGHIWIPNDRKVMHTNFIGFHSSTPEEFPMISLGFNPGIKSKLQMRATGKLHQGTAFLARNRRTS